MKTLYLFVLLPFFTNCLSLQCKALKRAIVHPKIQGYLHSELHDRKTLYVVQNQFCNLNDTIGSVRVVTVDHNIAEKGKNYLRITSFKEFKEYKEMSIEYPLEGAVFNVKLDNNDQVTDVVVVEK